MSVELDSFAFVPNPTDPTATVTSVTDSLTEDCERYLSFYRRQFVGKPHYNYLAVVSPMGPLSFSLIHLPHSSSYLGFLRADFGWKTFDLPYACIPTSTLRKLLRLKPTYAMALNALLREVPVESLMLCQEGDMLEKELVELEEKQVVRSYKFGVGYVKEGQMTELEMLSNCFEDISPEFDTFLHFLGDRIRLKGWKGYRAGLDVNNDQTGTHSVYTRWHGYEIMFHVSPLLPDHPTDIQQLERKRHVGNDIVLILFQDRLDQKPFQLSSMKSKQNHVICLVAPDSDNGYVVRMVRKKEVPDYPPVLPEPMRIRRDDLSRDFLLYKLVNSERASYHAPSFANKITRTRTVLLQHLAQRFVKVEQQH